MLTRRSLTGLLCAATPGVLASPHVRAQAKDRVLAERSLGRPDAPVVMIEYASLTCGHCKRFHQEILPRVKETFIDTGKVRLVYRHYPLDRAALLGAVMAQCVDPPHFFAMIDVLFRAEDRWGHSPDPQAALASLGLVAGVSRQRFEACVADQTLIDAILRERQDGERQFNVSSTPTFVIGQRVHRGVSEFAEFSKILVEAGAR